jgi:hypothetical protein
MSTYLSFLVIPLFALSIALADSRTGATGALPTPTFTDVAIEAGIRSITYSGSTEKRHLLESVGCGVAFFDYDKDGFPDVYIVNGWQITDRMPSIRGKNVLYRNKGDGTFEDVTDLAGVGDDNWGIGVCAADYNNDGWLDLYVTNFGPNRLYRNNGDGTFTDVAAQAGVADERWSTGATFFDADRDGDLDLYVVNYVTASIEDVLNAEPSLDWNGVTKVMTGPRGLKGAADAFYRNNGDGTFTEATVESGLIDIGEAYGLGVCATDYDLDGDVDVYVANDAEPNYLYQNNGDGTFLEVGLYANAAVAGSGAPQASMGVDFGDYDNDADFDGFVTNFSGECSTLYRNLGDGFFEDATESAGLWQPTYLPMSWGTGFFDYDNDGDLDLFIANGHIYPQVDAHLEYGETYAQINQLFENREGHFEDVTSAAGHGFQVLLSSRGCAFADYDNDGDVDILITNMDAPPTLLRNDGGVQRNWLIVQLEGTISNRAGIGAIIRVKTGNLIQMREIRSGNSYVSQNDLRAHLGLGNYERIDEIEVRWPSGGISKLAGVPARQILKIVEETNR